MVIVMCKIHLDFRWFFFFFNVMAWNRNTQSVEASKVYFKMCTIMVSSYRNIVLFFTSIAKKKKQNKM